MLTRKSCWQAVGGMDAENLPAAFNDVDYCLKLRAEGYQVVWTPFATLYHHESASRGDDLAADKRAVYEAADRLMRARWGKVLANDPFYSPYLSLFSEDFTLADKPRHRPPWTDFDSPRRAPDPRCDHYGLPRLAG